MWHKVCVNNYPSNSALKNPAYGRQRISWPMRIVGPIQFWRACMIIYIYFYFLIGFVIFLTKKIVPDGHQNSVSSMRTRQSPAIFWWKNVIVSVLLSASVEIFFVSRMRDFLRLLVQPGSLRHWEWEPELSSKLNSTDLHKFIFQYKMFLFDD